MAFSTLSGSKGAKSESRRRNANKSGIYDTINVILGLCVIMSTIIIFIDSDKYEKFFTAVFIFAASMNICMGIKYFKRNEILKTIALMIAGVFLIGMTVLTVFAFWFQ